MKMRNWLAAAVAALMLAWGAAALAGEKLACGTGVSTAKDAKAAGEEAAKQAKAALGDAAPKLVLVHYAGALVPKAAEVAAGVASVFPKDLLYGCEAYAPITQESNDAAVAVLALGGDVAVTAAVAETKGDQDDVACGQKIGEALKEAAGVEKPGKVLVLFGACHIPRDAALAKGVGAVLGEKFPIVGAAAFRDDILVKGEVVKSSNAGLLLTGGFTCGFGLKKDMSAEGLVTSARDAFASAIGEKKDKLALVLVFDCGGRRGEMQKLKIAEKELAAMKEVAGAAPIFGFYGSGEIGCPTTGAVPQGVGYDIAACVIIGE